MSYFGRLPRDNWLEPPCLMVPYQDTLRLSLVMKRRSRHHRPYRRRGARSSGRLVATDHRSCYISVACPWTRSLPLPLCHKSELLLILGLVPALTRPDLPRQTKILSLLAAIFSVQDSTRCYFSSTGPSQRLPSSRAHDDSKGLLLQDQRHLPLRLLYHRQHYPHLRQHQVELQYLACQEEGQQRL